MLVIQDLMSKLILGIRPNMLVKKGGRLGHMLPKSQPGGPAEKAGIRTGDVLTKINGKDIKSSLGLTHELFKYKPGDKVTVTIFRDNKTMDVSVTLVEIKSQ